MPYIQRRPREDGDLRKVVDWRLSTFEQGLDRFGLGPPLKYKPKSLADVAELIRGNPDWFNYAMYQFQEAFYLEQDRHTQQAMLDPAPVPLELDWNDAWIGAIGEHLAQRWSLKVPRVDPGGGVHGQRHSRLLVHGADGTGHRDRGDASSVPSKAALHVRGAAHEREVPEPHEGHGCRIGDDTREQTGS